MSRNESDEAGEAPCSDALGEGQAADDAGEVRRQMNALSQLSKAEQTRLLEELNYMNLEEIRGSCSARGIPSKVMAEYPNGRIKATKKEFARSWRKTKAGNTGCSRRSMPTSRTSNISAPTGTGIRSQGEGAISSEDPQPDRACSKETGRQPVSFRRSSGNSHRAT